MWTTSSRDGDAMRGNRYLARFSEDSLIPPRKPQTGATTRSE
jgi:hypothetical protein